jgi:hypothetical protein
MTRIDLSAVKVRSLQKFLRLCRNKSELRKVVVILLRGRGCMLLTQLSMPVWTGSWSSEDCSIQEEMCQRVDGEEEETHIECLLCGCSQMSLLDSYNEEQTHIRRYTI